MLFAYRQQTQRLLQDKGQARFNLQDIDVYINQARVQIALAAECLRFQATITLTAGESAYAFSSGTFVGNPTLPTGLGGVGNIRSVAIQTGAGGYKNLSIKAWEWFEYFFIDVTAPVPAVPTHASRLQPGIGGTIWYAPIPDAAYVSTWDTVAYPSDLGSDSDNEPLPRPWTDAVPFYSAYLALLSAGDRQGADDYWYEYQRFEQRGTQLTTPSKTPRSYPGGRGAGIVAGRVALTGPAGPTPTTMRQQGQQQG